MLQVLLYLVSDFTHDYTRFQLYYAVDLALTLSMAALLPLTLREVKQAWPILKIFSSALRFRWFYPCFSSRGAFGAMRCSWPSVWPCACSAPMSAASSWGNTAWMAPLPLSRSRPYVKKSWSFCRCCCCCGCCWILAICGAACHCCCCHTCHHCDPYIFFHNLCPPVFVYQIHSFLNFCCYYAL